MRQSPFLTLALLMATAGCADLPSAPEPTLDAVSAGAFVDGRTVTPMAAELTVVWNVDQSADALAACAPRPGLAVGAGSGWATQLGSVQVVRMEHCSIDLAAEFPILDGDGEFELRAADGSTLEGHYTFLLLPSEIGGFAIFSIEAGSGRFQGAEGMLEVTEGLSDLTCADLLCLTGATLTATLEGWISVPRGRGRRAPAR